MHEPDLELQLHRMCGELVALRQELAAQQHELDELKSLAVASVLASASTASSKTTSRRNMLRRLDTEVNNRSLGEAACT